MEFFIVDCEAAGSGDAADTIPLAEPFIISDGSVWGTLYARRALTYDHVSCH